MRVAEEMVAEKRKPTGGHEEAREDGQENGQKDWKKVEEEVDNKVDKNMLKEDHNKVDIKVFNKV